MNGILETTIRKLIFADVYDRIDNMEYNELIMSSAIKVGMSVEDLLEEIASSRYDSIRASAMLAAEHKALHDNAENDTFGCDPYAEY